MLLSFPGNRGTLEQSYVWWYYRQIRLLSCAYITVVTFTWKLTRPVSGSWRSDALYRFWQVAPVMPPFLAPSSPRPPHTSPTTVDMSVCLLAVCLFPATLSLIYSPRVVFSSKSRIHCCQTILPGVLFISAFNTAMALKRVVKDTVLKTPKNIAVLMPYTNHKKPT